MKKTNTTRTIGTSTIIKMFAVLLFFFTPLMADDFSSTVRVHRQSGASFSGTVIEVENGKTLVLTCGHGFFTLKKQPTGVSFYNKDGETSYPAKLLKQHRIWDLALIEINQELKVDVAAFADKMPQNYSKLSATGYHYFDKQKHYFTLVEKGWTTTDGELLFTANGKAVNGLSGASIRDKNNSIIAVQSGGTPHMINGARLETIIKFLSQ
jgi:hypothetical protein